jgi:8-oxo-dGTP pyrophosphatase MutT (NUDIX family)
MSKPHGPWTIHQSTRLYQNDFLELLEDQVTQPDGEPSRYAMVRLKPGVAVLPIEADGSVYLVRQFRYALGQESLEVVAGGLEAGEDPLAAAQRELQEELGGKADEWQALGCVDLETSMVSNPVDLFLAKGLHLGEPEPDATEEIRVVKLFLSDAVRLVESGGITHGTSCVLILRAYLQEIGHRQPHTAIPHNTKLKETI